MMQKSRSMTLIDNAHKMGFSQATINELISLNIPDVKGFSSKQIKALRKREKVSQSIFASYLNVSPSTVRRWERGDVAPRSAALRLLGIIDRHGLGIIREP